MLQIMTKPECRILFTLIRIAILFNIFFEVESK